MGNLGEVSCFNSLNMKGQKSKFETCFLKGTFFEFLESIILDKNVHIIRNYKVSYIKFSRCQHQTFSVVSGDSFFPTTVP